jgi:hypothetical protein
MVGDLGRLGETDGFPFASGADAEFLSKVKLKLDDKVRINSDEAKRIHEIYQRYYGYEAKQISIDDIAHGC